MARIAGVGHSQDEEDRDGPYVHLRDRPDLRDEILEEARVSPDLRTATLGEDQVARIRDVIDANYRVEGTCARKSR